VALIQLPQIYAGANICVYKVNDRSFIMDARIQFRVEEETKRLAQQMAESQGRTLSDA